jgi:hypothetical protein
MHNIHKSHTVFRRFDVPNPQWKRLRDAFECLHFVPSCQPAFFQRQARYVISHVPEGKAQVAAEVQLLNTLERDGRQHNRLLSPSFVSLRLHWRREKLGLFFTFLSQRKLKLRRSGCVCIHRVLVGSAHSRDMRVVLPSTFAYLK